MEQSPHAKERRISALAVSRGFAVGPVYFFEEDRREPQPTGLEADEIDGELRRFRAAVGSAIEQLKKLSHDPSAKRPVSHILDVQLLMIENSAFVERVESIIRQRGMNAAWAIKTVADEHVQRQSAVADRHLREKHLDIEDVTARLVKALEVTADDINGSLSGRVIVARELRPSAAMEIAAQHPAAFVTERGGWTSHCSIIAREFHIPMVSGVRDLKNVFRGVDRAMVDGVTGSVVLDPGSGIIDRRGFVSTRRPIARASDRQTLDGVPITVRANVDSVEAYAKAEKAGAQGVGLFRSEALIHRGRYPSEEQQYTAYVQMAERVGASGLNIRTFDVGVNDIKGHRSESNPALGLRSLRLSLTEPSEFRVQVRAILRAAAGRHIDVVLPMVADAADLARAKTIIEHQRATLAGIGAAIGTPRVGAMIETASAVMTVDAIARSAEFLCLGTNDLVQYLLAVDRDNQSVAEWYQSLHPAVVYSIAKVLEVGRERQVPVQICGEIAASPFYVPLLIGLGAREFSVNSNSVAGVLKVLSGIRVSDCRALAKLVLEKDAAEESEDLLRDHYTKNWSDLFPPGLLNSRHR